ncbi:glucose-6-phosphate dehydrogenase assembly protein OpcA [Parenemella sanctibonifatiensis]|uniref:Oxidoreductase n=1 Tax=Parenemella sanctibonifatiensis TaxID=2016505 RepID=A0A255EFD3_9ACTN|nr:glucose-6-phosphate dehydrogenase assembly protein OpcA [Parenemella sanctibonifatiensis]OYN88295.1 oxidoreductase [Parenemella sanctibonifatiensis]
MIIELTDTTTADIAQAILDARAKLGNQANGMVLTLVLASNSRDYKDALDAALQASREHPSRILLVIQSTAKADRLNAEIRMGEDGPGEIITLRLSGELADHPQSVLLPLLLPDSPIALYWPGKAPEVLRDTALVSIATRRITDAQASANPLDTLLERAKGYEPGDTDLAWTRLTRWRALLAASLDQCSTYKVNGGVIEAEKDNASAVLLAAWLEDKLGVDIDVVTSDGPAISAVRLSTVAGEIVIERDHDPLATYSIPGQPKRSVALARRPLTELLTEELRRMDPDDVYAAATQQLLKRAGSKKKKKSTSAKD